MNGARTWTTVVLGGLTALALTGCATAPPRMESADAIAARQRLMKNVGANWADIQAKAKANNVEAIAVNAEALALHSQRITGYFPEGSYVPDKSAAKPEIWQKWPEFEGAARNLQMQAEKLRDAARSKNAEATQALVKDFGRNACVTCHNPFRVPPKS